MLLGINSRTRLFAYLLIFIWAGNLSAQNDPNVLEVIYHDQYRIHPDFHESGDNLPSPCWNQANGDVVLDQLGPNKNLVLNTNHPDPECAGLNLDSWWAETNQWGGRTYYGELNDQTPGNPDVFTFDDQNFFPLDTAAAAENYHNQHNYLFCMEAHTRFIYEGGEVFNFRGDDDVYVFINGRKAIDLGGVHGAQTQNVNLDNSASQLGIQIGVMYDFDFFYCERQIVGSSIRIETSIDFLPPIGPVGFDPVSTSFPYQQSVRLIGDLDADVFYKVDNGPWTLYNNISILLDKTSTIEAYQQRNLYSLRISDTTDHTYTHVPPGSELTIRKVTGENIDGNGTYMTELDQQFQVTVKVFFANTRMNTLNLKLASGNDAETIVLTNPSINSDAQVFSGLINLSVGEAGASGDGDLQTKYFDSVNVSWANPLNNTDIISGGFITKPSEKQSNIYFVTDATGNTLLDSLAGATNMLYIVVEDQVIDSSMLANYKVLVENIPGVANANGADQVSVQLSELVPGKYIASLPLQNLAPNLGDAALQALVGDQIKASYVDPKTPTDISQVQKGLGVASEINGALFFVDKLGNPIPRSDTLKWSLLEDSVYLRYIDDPGNGWAKKVFITATRPLEAVVTSDTATFNMGHKGDSVWEAGIPIQDSKIIDPNNQKLDIYFLGILTAIVGTHKNNITAEVTDGKIVSASMQVSYPDQTAIIDIKDKEDPNNVVDRETKLVEICITEQIFSVGQLDTLVLKEVTCENSLDKITDLILIQQTLNQNQYCGTVTKSEGVLDVNDNNLTCNPTDIIEAKYEDPVHGDEAQISVQWEYNIQPKVEILTSAGLPLSVDVESPLGNQYVVRLTAADSILTNPSETRVVTLTAVNNLGIPLDNIQVTVTEVAKDANGAAIFQGTVDVGYVLNSTEFTPNVLEGIVNPENVYNSFDITGTYGGVASEEVALIAAYIKGEEAWIEDTDGDGQADKIMITFATLTPGLPSGIPSIHWPTIGQTQSALGSQITRTGTSLDTIEVNFLPISPFAENTTVGGAGADVSLPNDIYFRGRTLVLQDRVKPVAISGLVMEGNEVRTVVVGTEDSSFLAPDTISIEVSEVIENLANDGSDAWNRLFCYEMICGDLQCLPLVFLDEPTIDDETGRVFTGQIGESGISDKSCIKMRADAQYADLSNNTPAEKEISPTVNKADLSFTDADVLYPVAGVEKDASLNYYDNLAGYSFNIIPSYGVNLIGHQDLNLPCDQNLGRNPQPLTVDNQCLSVARLETNRNEGYIAQIRIYDHLGKYINSSVQQFGKCGELDDARRVTRDGRLRSYLLWDLKDIGGNYVANGVYIWKIDYLNLDGSPSNMQQDILKQGVARNRITDPLGHCNQALTPWP